MRITRYHLYLLLLCCICASLFAGCTGVENNNKPLAQGEKLQNSQSNAGGNESAWMTLSITDAVTGKKISLIELAAAGRPIIIHTFAVWCPACSMQLRETAKLVQNNPGTYEIVGIDIDPRETTEMVKKHVEKNDFVGMYGVAPTDMTRSLVKTFGTRIVQSLPQTIVISNKSVAYIGDGVFVEGKLKTIIEELPSQRNKSEN